MIVKWEDVWGGDAEYDIAQDMEDLYEETFHKSAVYWESFDEKDSKGFSDELDGRPEEYATGGYTSDFETWGVETSKEAIGKGFNTLDGIIEYFKTKGKENE